MNQFLTSRRALVNTYYLNIRKEPKFECPTLPGSPIEYGHEVEVLETREKWCRIKSSKIENGWVNGKYLEMD